MIYGGIDAWVEEIGDLVFYMRKPDAWNENARLKSGMAAPDTGYSA